MRHIRQIRKDYIVRNTRKSQRAFIHRLAEDTINCVKEERKNPTVWNDGDLDDESNKCYYHILPEGNQLAFILKNKNERSKVIINSLYSREEDKKIKKACLLGF